MTKTSPAQKKANKNQYSKIKGSGYIRRSFTIKESWADKIKDYISKLKATDNQ